MIKLKPYLTFLFFALFSHCTLAAGGLDAGLDVATDFKTWFYSIVGILAVIYLLYVGLMCWAEKKQWADFGSALIGVAAVGGVPTACVYLWSVFV